MFLIRLEHNINRNMHNVIPYNKPLFRSTWKWMSPALVEMVVAVEDLEFLSHFSVST